MIMEPTIAMMSSQHNTMKIRNYCKSGHVEKKQNKS